ncbi:MAG: peptide MFS transporter [Bacteroidetes bacterium]|nr:peptide MFS transporter [Bacteroidota bacterium]
MWERFGYYLMIGIFQIFMTESIEKGGMGLDRSQAADIFGTFIAFVFLTPFLGGLLADRKLGYIKSVFIGGTLMGLGYMGLAIHTDWSFYLSLLLIIVGNGFFKPNISTLLGNLYSEEKYKSLKDSGFNIFYMGINVGACVCNLCAAFMRNKYGWGAAFFSAGIGMFLGLIIFAIGIKYFKHADVKKPVQSEDMSMNQIFSKVFLPAIIAGLIGWFIPGNIFGTDSTDAFILAAIPVVIFYISLYKRANETDRKPILALLAIMAVSVMFWAIFKQNGTALTTWAQYYTDREMPKAISPTADKMYLAEKDTFTIRNVPAFDKKFKPIKVNEKQTKVMDYPVYFRNIAPDKKPQEDETVMLYNTELFQSINPLWVVLLTPLVIGFFALLRRKGREPSTPLKIAIGLLISTLSTLVMVAAVYVCSNGAIKASPWWLVGCYGVVTVGELFLSPMGLSLVSKISPPRLTALMMGGWFLATSLGNKLSGVLASLWDKYENKANFFLVNMVLLGIATIIMFAMLKWLKRLIGNKV